MLTRSTVFLVLTSASSTLEYLLHVRLWRSKCFVCGALQEAQLSQRSCAMLRVIEYSAKSLKITFEMTLLNRACVSSIVS